MRGVQGITLVDSTWRFSTCCSRAPRCLLLLLLPLQGGSSGGSQGGERGGNV